VVHSVASRLLEHQRRLLAVESIEGVIERGEPEKEVTGSPVLATKTVAHGQMNPRLDFPKADKL
jgi:repressor of nif and glnA expression